MSDPIKKPRKLHTPRRAKTPPPEELRSAPPHHGNIGISGAEFGAEVTRMRLARGLTQDQAAKLLGLRNRSSLAQIERGNTEARAYMVAGFRAILSPVI